MSEFWLPAQFPCLGGGLGERRRQGCNMEKRGWRTFQKEMQAHSTQGHSDGSPTRLPLTTRQTLKMTRSINPAPPFPESVDPGSGEGATFTESSNSAPGDHPGWRGERRHQRGRHRVTPPPREPPQGPPAAPDGSPDPEAAPQTVQRSLSDPICGMSRFKNNLNVVC